MVGHRFSRRAGLGQQHTLHVREQEKRIELGLGIGDGLAGRFWMRVAVQISEDDVEMGICCRCLARHK